MASYKAQFKVFMASFLAATYCISMAQAQTQAPDGQTKNTPQQGQDDSKVGGYLGLGAIAGGVAVVATIKPNKNRPFPTKKVHELIEFASTTKDGRAVGASAGETIIVNRQKDGSWIVNRPVTGPDGKPSIEVTTIPGRDVPKAGPSLGTQIRREVASSTPNSDLGKQIRSEIVNSNPLLQFAERERRVAGMLHDVFGIPQDEALQLAKSSTRETISAEMKEEIRKSIFDGNQFMQAAQREEDIIAKVSSHFGIPKSEARLVVRQFASEEIKAAMESEIDGAIVNGGRAASAGLGKKIVGSMGILVVLAGLSKVASAETLPSTPQKNLRAYDGLTASEEKAGDIFGDTQTTTPTVRQAGKMQ